MIEELAKISDSEERVVVATGRFIGEGFDDPRLDTLFLSLPLAWRGTPAMGYQVDHSDSSPGSGVTEYVVEYEDDGQMYSGPDPF